MNPALALPYYPRPEFLAGVLAVLTSGLQQGVTLFAPRRQGKTSFVMNELLPAAQEAGWQGVYLDLWRLRSDPARGLVEGLEAQVFKPAPGLLAQWKLSRLSGTIKPPMAEFKIEAEPEKAFAPVGGAVSLEHRLAVVLDALVERADVTLLVLDEFQALAGVQRDDFVAAFRTALQKHRGRLLVFYTGSSRAALNAMFRRAKAPLFQSAHALALPELGRGFVEDRAAFLAQRTSIVVDLDALESAFERLGKSPEFLNWLIVDIMVRGEGDVPAAMHAWLENQRMEVFDEVLDKLNGIDLGLLLALAVPGHPSCFSAEGVRCVQGFCGGEFKVTSSKVQTSLNRLAKHGLIAPTGNKGEYEIEDRSLLVWLRESMAHDAGPA
ncbi:MAG: hypothetical protein ABWY08_18660 [Comamonas sp.]